MFTWKCFTASQKHAHTHPHKTALDQRKRTQMKGAHNNLITMMNKYEMPVKIQWMSFITIANNVICPLPGKMLPVKHHNCTQTNKNLSANSAPQPIQAGKRGNAWKKRQRFRFNNRINIDGKWWSNRELCTPRDFNLKSCRNIQLDGCSALFLAIIQSICCYSLASHILTRASN